MGEIIIMIKKMLIGLVIFCAGFAAGWIVVAPLQKNITMASCLMMDMDNDPGLVVSEYLEWEKAFCDRLKTSPGYLWNFYHSTEYDLICIGQHTKKKYERLNYDATDYSIHFDGSIGKFVIQPDDIELPNIIARLDNLEAQQNAVYDGWKVQYELFSSLKEKVDILEGLLLAFDAKQRIMEKYIINQNDVFLDNAPDQ